jgi:hypothetical protein
LQSIDDELREAEQNEDTGRREILTAEKEWLLDELKSDTAFQGHLRRFAAEPEKARKAVSHAIDRALGRIKEHHPVLANHLREHIKLGIACRYEPDDVPWDF